MNNLLYQIPNKNIKEKDLGGKQQMLTKQKLLYVFVPESQEI